MVHLQGSVADSSSSDAPPLATPGLHLSRAVCAQDTEASSSQSPDKHADPLCVHKDVSAAIPCLLMLCTHE